MKVTKRQKIEGLSIPNASPRFQSRIPPLGRTEAIREVPIVQPINTKASIGGLPKPHTYTNYKFPTCVECRVRLGLVGVQLQRPEVVLYNLRFHAITCLGLIETYIFICIYYTRVCM
jgi:hypothetical protein